MILRSLEVDGLIGAHEHAIGTQRSIDAIFPERFDGALRQRNIWTRDREPELGRSAAAAATRWTHDFAADAAFAQRVLDALEVRLGAFHDDAHFDSFATHCLRSPGGLRSASLAVDAKARRMASSHSSGLNCIGPLPPA